MNIQILGISSNNPFSQKTFADSLKLPYPLLSDFPHLNTIKSYAGLNKQWASTTAQRAFFLVDKDGIIRGRWLGTVTDVFPTGPVRAGDRWPVTAGEPGRARRGRRDRRDPAGCYLRRAGPARGPPVIRVPSALQRERRDRRPRPPGIRSAMRIASEAARFSTGYVRVGLVPGDGDTYFLPRLIGTARALELLWTADFIEAPEALRLGIVNRVVPAGTLSEETYALARRVADGPQIPIRMIKRLVYQSMRLDLRTHLDLVSSHMAVVRDTEDHKEGVQAFKDKRAPKFKGR